jgi:hypothetical protein
MQKILCLQDFVQNVKVLCAKEKDGLIWPFSAQKNGDFAGIQNPMINRGYPKIRLSYGILAYFTRLGLFLQIIFS